MHGLAQRILAGDLRAVAQACRIVDEQAVGFETIARELFPHTGRSRVIGITGSPGTGKSSLSDTLIELLRARGERVGVVAIDPSSPFTGGALLGDRIRMQRHASDAGVFIRSLGTRGAQGGLSRSTRGVVQVLDAWGAETVLLETVGVGQSELDVLGVSDTILVVVNPGMGDEIQANKAGILEIADVFALNKADREGAEATHALLEAAISLGKLPVSPGVGHLGFRPSVGSGGAVPRIVRTVATRGQGVPDLLFALDAHACWLADTEEGRQRKRVRRALSAERFLRETVASAVLERLGSKLSELAKLIAANQLEPHAASQDLLRELGWS